MAAFPGGLAVAFDDEGLSMGEAYRFIVDARGLAHEIAAGPFRDHSKTCPGVPK